MLKGPVLISSVLHLLVLYCNCRTYDYNIVSNNFQNIFQNICYAPYQAYLGGQSYKGPRISEGVLLASATKQHLLKHLCKACCKILSTFIQIRLKTLVCKLVLIIFPFFVTFSEFNFQCGSLNLCFQFDFSYEWSLCHNVFQSIQLVFIDFEMWWYIEKLLRPSGNPCITSYIKICIKWNVTQHIWIFGGCKKLQKCVVPPSIFSSLFFHLFGPNDHLTA